MNKEQLQISTNDAISLLKQLIAIPSLSKEEDKAADCIQNFFHKKKIVIHRSGNNIWSTNKYFDGTKPSILLNSHLDTVPPSKSYKKDPFTPEVINDKLFGLGSTDAGASLVSLALTFIYFCEKQNMQYNIVFAATAEEEISGSNGIESLFSLPQFKNCFRKPGSFAIVGEPTQLDLAIAEKGLLVLDCTVNGKAGHAAREEGENAIYKTIEAINWFKNYSFNKISPLLGEVKMNATSINTENKAHNIVPAQCSFVVDIRVTDQYTHEEILQTIKEHVSCEINPRSTRLRSSSISEDHPIVQAGLLLGKKLYGSPTLSDQALIPIPSLKCGPGNSAQSHTADEFILLDDIKHGINFYVKMIGKLTDTQINHSTNKLTANKLIND